MYGGARHSRCWGTMDHQRRQFCLRRFLASVVALSVVASSALAGCGGYSRDELDKVIYERSINNSAVDAKPMAGDARDDFRASQRPGWKHRQV